MAAPVIKDAITIVLEYPYPRSLVWRALTDPRLLSQWFMTADFEATEGAAFTFHDKPFPCWGGTVDGKVLEVDRPHRLVLSWQEAPDAPCSRVTFTLEETGDGTRLIFRHADIPCNALPLNSKYTRTLKAIGWRRILGKRLLAVLEHVQKHGFDVSVPASAD